MLNSFSPTQAATAGALAADAAPLPAALPAGVAQPAMPALAAFAQWLGFGQQAEAPMAAAEAPFAAPDAANGEPASDNAETAADMSTAPAIQDAALLAAMAQPMAAPGASQQAPADAGATPLSAAELRAGLQAAVPPSAARTGASEAMPVQAPAAQAIQAQGMPAQLMASRSASAQAAPASNGGAGAAAGDDSLGQTLSAAFRPLPAAVRAAVAPSGAVDPGAAAAAASTDAPVGTESGSGATGERPASANTGLNIGAAAPATVRPATDSVALAGPPAAWRQTLHEALGDRLNLQLTKNAEQAVIRLEPPMLGRIEIAIRHSGGTLEVALTATHSEVLRQLHAVSDNLRGDLAQRQFTDVAVTVAQAARGGAAPSGDQQGRGRQPERDDQSQDPGRALAEAGDPSSTFSLSGRA